MYGTERIFKASYRACRNTNSVMQGESAASCIIPLYSEKWLSSPVMWVLSYRSRKCARKKWCLKQTVFICDKGKDHPVTCQNRQRRTAEVLAPPILDLGAGRGWEINTTSFVMLFQDTYVSRKNISTVSWKKICRVNSNKIFVDLFWINVFF